MVEALQAARSLTSLDISANSQLFADADMSIITWLRSAAHVRRAVGVERGATVLLMAASTALAQAVAGVVQHAVRRARGGTRHRDCAFQR